MTLAASPSPLYLQVYRMIADDIAAGVLKPGDRLPAERDLCQKLGVSRTTVRRAFAELIQNGLIVSSVGLGAFVAGGESLAEPPNMLMSFSELGASRGFTPSAEVLEQELRQADLDQAELFSIVPGAELFWLRRLRLLDGLPVALDEALIPTVLVPDIAQHDYTCESLYKIMDDAGAGPTRAAYTVEAGAAGACDAQLLGTPAGAPVLIASTVGRDVQQRVVEHTRTVYRADRYRFHATLAGRR